MAALPANVVSAVQTASPVDLYTSMNTMLSVFCEQQFGHGDYEYYLREMRFLTDQVSLYWRTGKGFITRVRFYVPGSGAFYHVILHVSTNSSETGISGLAMRFEAIGEGSYRSTFPALWDQHYHRNWVQVTRPATEPVYSPAPPAQPDSSTAAPEQTPEASAVQRSFGQKLGLLLLTVLAVLAEILMAGIAIGTLVHDKDRFAIGIVASLGLSVMIMVARLVRDKGLYDVAIALGALGIVAISGIQWSLQLASPLVFMAAMCHGAALAILWFMDRMPANRKPSLHVGWLVLAFYLAQGLITYLAG